MLPKDDDKIFATWLDGRFTKIEGEETTHDSHNDHGHGGGGAMTLRTATFNIEGKLYNEKELDHLNFMAPYSIKKLEQLIH